ncbi:MULTISPECIES: hypothetical protein [Sphingomonas]|uniref:hypothetical protein n=1 Tax=Sphingomonas TaxID=13687 RepID=UPI001C84EC17|nr:MULTISPECIES: hypothetical protein [Sphingomonas]MCP8891417.1 hypothetical protein [Sphingomonas faeni]
MKGHLSLLLLLGALVGLFGQQAAYAGGPALAPAMEASHAMPTGMDCAGTEGMPEATHEQPCKGLTLACIAQMGCMIPMTIQDRLPLTAPRVPLPPVAYRAVDAPLAGRDLMPELQPPTV